MIAVCLKWTPSRLDGGPLGPDPGDDRFADVSPADRAALEVALRLADSSGDTVTAIAAGPAGADRILRDAIAAGASRAIRLDMPTDSDSRDVAFELAQLLGDASVVLCGDYSLDRGSGSVPAFVAHHRRAAQALGLVSVDVAASGSASGRVHAVRRLDGGRREVLSVPMPCVLSVEGSVAVLRRAPLPRVLAARTATIEVVTAPPAHHKSSPAIVTPYRPRARVMSPPHGSALDRVRSLTDTGAASARGETVELPPREAAARIVAALREWGHLG
ncbi:MAG: mycofactocin-associated electron transfer flavoprotein beta subunit [Acidimicrobiales bacterium]